ncbi:MAG TPA: hypothetical protein DD706_12565 [Nitrospiraceae bacterium]|nr:hypothetical protein [Nitrospiraceae bacterium]
MFVIELLAHAIQPNEKLTELLMMELCRLSGVCSENLRNLFAKKDVCPITGRKNASRAER